MRICLQGASPSHARPSFHSICVSKGLCSTINTAAFLPQAVNPPESRGEENPEPSSVTQRVMLPVGAQSRGSVGQRHRAAPRTVSYTPSWNCTITHPASALSPHCAIPNFCSAASQWVSDLLISLFKTVPVSPICTAGCPSLHGWRGTSAGLLTDCIPPHKTFIFFSTTLT